MIKIWIGLILLQASSQRCLEGCLRCTPENKCLYCDVLNGYQLRSERCIKPSIPNCLLTNDKLQCLQCSPEFYLDRTLNQCIDLFEEIKVQNCELHQGPNTCQLCVQNFYLKNGACNQIVSPIPNCRVENERGICLQCQNDFIRTIDKKGCIPKPTIQNCQTNKWVTCRNCNAGFLNNQNYYLDMLFSNRKQRDPEVVNNILKTQIKNSAEGIYFPTCQKSLVDNCMVFESFSKCKQCNQGYFVNEQKQCQPNPKETINNCLRYSSLTTCIACTQGYHLQKEICVKAYNIENCMIYKNDSQTTVCTRCFDDYYLSAENLCTQRTDQSNIQLCVKLAYNFEKCDQCLDEYIPTTDGFRCLGLIKNCFNYEISNKNDIYLRCSQCKDGYYYDVENRICVPGTVDFCNKYSKIEDKCIECRPKFYLIENKCEPQKQLNFCQKYHKTQPNTCVTCDQNNFLFSTVQSCQKVDIIPRCEVYGTKTSCIKCKDGYYLRTPSQCDQIALKENCLQKQANNCIKCLPHYALLMGQCVKAYSWVQQGCKINNLQGITPLSDLRCDSCQKNFVPINAQETFLCLEQRTLNREFNLNKDQNFDNDCLQYNIVNGNYNCVKCIQDRVLVDGFCKENCYKAGKLTLYKQWITLHNVTGESMNDSIKVEYTNICEKTIPNCAVASMDLNQDFINIKYSCEKCVEGFIPITDLKNQYGVISKNSELEKELRVHMPSTTGPGVICVDPQNSIILGDLDQRKQVDQCEYYLRISKNSFGCRKCMHGATGKIIQAIKQCKIFKNPFECFECEQGYFLKQSNECRPIQRIDNCLKYDPKENDSKCIECVTSHYLKNENGIKICSPRIISANKTNCDLQIETDECTCKVGYVIHPNTNNCLKKPDFCINATVVNEQIQCQSCDRSKAYLDNNQCKIGTTPYCKQFLINQNQCEICQNGYFMSNGTCKAHTQNLDALCLDWNSTQKDVCNKCKPESTKFKKIKHCKQVNEIITNCKLYSDIFSCMECEAGYYLNNVSKRCLPIPPSSHCLQLKVVDLSNANVYDKNDYTEKIRFVHTCEKCEVNYYRRQYSINEKYYVDGNLDTQQLNLFRCINWLGYHMNNCSPTDTDVKGVENFGNFCFGCQTNYIPMNSRNKYVCVNKSYITERKHGFTLDANCTAYYFDENRNMLCKRCSLSYFLDETTNSCVDGVTTTCTNPNQPFVFYVNSSNQIEKQVCRALINAAITDCVSYVTSYTQANNTSSWVKSESCYECSSTKFRVFLEVVAPIKHMTPINVIDQDLDIKQFDQMYPAITCKDKPAVGLTNSNSKIDNCAVYKINTTSNKMYCTRCKQGYNGRVFTDATDFGIETCELMTTCQTGNPLGGLHLNVNWLEAKVHPISLFSCQKCQTTGQIPVAFVNDVTTVLNANDVSIMKLFRTSFAKNNTEKFTDYVTAGGPIALTNSNQPASSYQIQCWDETKLESTTNPTASDVLSLSTALRIPANCGLIVFDINVLQNNVSCVACKPGYKINAYDATQTYRITDCVAIANCTNNTGEALNRCSGCTWKYDSITDSIGTTSDTNCIAVKQGHCFAGIMNNTTLECYVCDPGYELIDKQCLIIKVPRCDATSNNLNDSFNQTHLMLGNRIFQYSIIANKVTIPGCTKCEDPNDILYMNTVNDDFMHTTICTQILDTNGVYNSGLNTTYISQNFQGLNNCLRYGYKNAKFVCVQCQNTYRLNTSNFTCELVQTGMNSLLPNCLIALSSDQTICQICENNYINIGGLCRSQSETDYVDTNCLTTAGAQKTNYQSICAKCKTGYYAKQTVSPFNRCTLIPAQETNCIDYLDETGCVDCAPGYGLMLIKKLNSDQKKRVCIKLDTNNDNLYKHDPKCDKLTVISTTDSLQQQRLICRKCLPHSVLTTNFIEYNEQCYNVVNPINNCIKYDSPDPQLDILSVQLQEIESKDFKCLECENINTYYLDRIQNQCILRTVIDSCENYDQFANRCKKCKQGNLLSIDMRTCYNFKNNKTVGYLDGCRDIEGCNKNTWYEGMNSTMSTLYSCHKCVKENEIPFAIGTIIIDQNSPGYEVFINSNEVDSQFKPWKNTNIDSQSMVRCLKPLQDTFGLTQNFSFPSNCGLGFVNVGPLLDIQADHNASQSSGNANLDFNKTTIRCHACKPGFKPSRQNYTLNGSEQQLKYLVTSCTAITNCENSTWLNGCSQCQAGYAHPYINGTTQYDQCVQVPEYHKECWSYDQTLLRCVFCKKGTYLNKDYICELINTPNCKPRQFQFNKYLTLNILMKGIYSSPDYVGCNRCETGFVGVYVPAEKSVCVSSLYHINNTLVQDSLYIKNCVEYSLEGRTQLWCRKCMDGFVISFNKKSCFAENNIQNCVEATSDTQCNICKPGFVMINRQCVAAAIENCEEYAKDNFDCRFCKQYEQVCLRCKPEFYLEGNVCQPGLIRNCRIQETSTICKECQENFTLILSKKGTSYCYPNDPRYNCKSFKVDLFQAQVLQCDKCFDSTFILSNSETDKSITSCMQFIFTHNCLKYDNNPIALGNSSFRCVECDQNYFIKDNKCVLRTIKPNECVAFQFDQDLCLKCQLGYFISSDGTQCIAYPQGIQGCETYLSENNCLKCLPDYFQKEFECIAVNKKVDQCLYYEDEGICQKCSPGFQNIQGKCFQVQAQNCETLESLMACSSCPVGYYLKTENGITSCIKTAIVNCVEVMENEPYDCLKCTGNFYPNKQECTAIVTLITDCLEYSSPSLCQRCQSPSALSSDKTSCVRSPELMNHIDLECSDNLLNKDPVCSTCQPGFVFQYGKCVACKTQVGCLMCDANDRKKCMICSQGFIMTPEGNCIKPMIESSGLDDLGRSLSELNMDDLMYRRL